MKKRAHDNGEAIVFNIQRFSIHDGPGIRTTVFLKGCPLHCKWCSNPESIKGHPEVWFVDVKCIRGNCNICVEVCPKNAFQITDQGVTGIDRSRCNLCMECVKVCPSEAIEQIGRDMTVEEVASEIDQDSNFYQTSGGGVTFSGGEPALQSEFICGVAKICRRKGIHVALETGGAVEWDMLEKMLPFVDLFLYDIKHMDPQRHREGTCSPNDLILYNLVKLAPKAKVWVRIPIIPGYNDSESDIREIAQFTRSLPIEKISLLPYHNAGEPKYERLGETYLLKDMPLPGSKDMERLKHIAESYGYKVAIGR